MKEINLRIDSEDFINNNGCNILKTLSSSENMKIFLESNVMTKNFKLYMNIFEGCEEDVEFCSDLIKLCEDDCNDLLELFSRDESDSADDKEDKNKQLNEHIFVYEKFEQKIRELKEKLKQGLTG